MLVPPTSSLPVTEAENILPHDEQLARRWAVNSGDHIQQGGLARAFEELADVADLDNFCLCRCIGSKCRAHDCPLILILAPSFKSAGAAIMTLSPPTNPL